MVKKFAKLSIVTLTLLLNGCGGDNAHNGTGTQGGNTSSQAQGNALATLQQNVFATHAQALLQNVDAIATQVNAFTTVSEANVQTLKESFTGIVREWKSVQATYVAADYDSSLIDTPQFIDYFHTGKKLDVIADVENALNQGGDIESALFKNSSQSITALEYLIFGKNESNAVLAGKMNTNSKRRVAAIKVVITNLQEKIKPIVNFYKNSGKFSSDATEASNSIVNVLIDSTFKLKEWRLGEASGIALKFKDNPNPQRLEYYNSNLSLVAIKAILTTHQDVMGVRDYANFGSFASENGAGEVVTSIRSQINNALSIANAFGTPLEGAITTSTVDPKVKNLYNTVKELQRLYFESLIQALNLTAEIIEADGD